MKNYESTGKASILRLITLPGVYDGKSVEIIGYVKIEHEGTAVYFNSEDAEKAIHINAVWLDFGGMNERDYISLNGKWCLIRGKYDKSFKGHLAAYSGTIEVSTIRERLLVSSQ